MMIINKQCFSAAQIYFKLKISILFLSAFNILYAVQWLVSNCEWLMQIRIYSESVFLLNNS